jgi:serine/threonine protein kinase
MAEPPVDFESTIVETPGSSPDATIQYGAPEPDKDAPRANLGNFRGWNVAEPLPTRGAEADIYIVEAGGERRILKLYRHRLEPKLEVLNRITEISRSHSRCFVIFHETGFDETSGRWYELQEYMPRGSLNETPLETKRAQHFIAQLVPEISDAIHCLHENDIVHCDIKPANVLIRHLEPLDLVLTDFGISSILDSDMSRKMTRMKGTPMYWAPEAFSGIVGRPCDWWGFGMILLELLSGEHPFEGLSDSRIISKLTVSNVGIPEFIGPEWGLLLKGLLTKDDSRRWGKAEIDRWSMGERDIPVYYEEPSPGALTPGKSKSFHFEGTDYHSPAELAAAWSKSENPWLAAPDTIRYLRTWFEDMGDFDAAAAIWNETNRADPEMAIFRFVHGNTDAPFSAIGHEIDIASLRDILLRASKDEANDAERRIAELAESGRLGTMYDEYARYGRQDRDTKRALKLIIGKKPHAAFSYIDALVNREAYLWPDDAKRDTEGSLTFIESLDTPPIAREWLGEIESSFVLPDALTGMLRSASAYNAGSARLKTLAARKLLIPKGADSEAWKKARVDDYERGARSIVFGHTDAMMERLDYVERSLGKMSAVSPFVTMTMTARLTARLRNDRISEADSQFLIDLSERFESLDMVSSSARKNHTIFSVAGGLIMWGLCFLPGNIGNYCAAAAFIVSLILWLIYYFVFRDVYGDEYKDVMKQRYSAGAAGIFLYFYIMPRFGPAGFELTYTLRPLFGVLLGFTVSYGIWNYKMSKITTDIIEECEMYCRCAQNARRDEQ